ncbi:hypothetical protein AeMF1_010047 [Aphanomyces euteiches]|nr:hypothetical protein AeMF1_010047 [Aphanomyces euteiches]KAH9190079.1 hypothetical protein AeNC1_007942 [Aphanomyces euteiches]
MKGPHSARLRLTPLRQPANDEANSACVGLRCVFTDIDPRRRYALNHKLFTRLLGLGTICKAAGATSWSFANECSLQVTLLTPLSDITVNTTEIVSGIRSLYGDAISLGSSSSVGVCDTSHTCMENTSDFVVVPSALELVNTTFARAKATVSFPTSSSYIISVNFVQGTSGQQFATTTNVKVVLQTTPSPSATTAINRTNTALPQGTTPAPTSTPTAQTNNSAVYMIIGVSIAVVFGIILAILFWKLRKARSNISSQQSTMSNEPGEPSTTQVDTASRRLSAPEPYSRRVFLSNTLASNDGMRYSTGTSRYVPSGYIRLEDDLPFPKERNSYSRIHS